MNPELLQAQTLMKDPSKFTWLHFEKNELLLVIPRLLKSILMMPLMIYDLTHAIKLVTHICDRNLIKLNCLLPSFIMNLCLCANLTAYITCNENIAFIIV